MATPEQLANKAAQVNEEEDKSGGAKHFDQPGVRFSKQEIRDHELSRKTATGESFRQHVEVGLIMLYALAALPVAKFGEFTKKIKLQDWDTKNKLKEEDLSKWLDEVQSGASKGGGASAAAAAREAALRKERDDLKKELAELRANKAGAVPAAAAAK